MCIFGPQGVGKTTIAQEYAGRFPIREEAKRRIVPVLNVTTPSPANVRGLASELLLALGDPLAETGSAIKLTLRLYKLIPECQVKQLILDELQHFGDYDGQTQVRNVSNWLKNLINKCKIPVVLMGMPYAEEILTSNDQLARRFKIRERLHHFSWKEEQARLTFRKFIQMLTSALPLSKNAMLSDEETSLRIFCATRGRLSFVVGLIRQAGGYAVERNLDTVDIDLLAEVYSETLGTLSPGPDGENPFATRTEHLNEWIAEIHNDSRTDGLVSPKRRRKGEPRKVRSSDILH